MGVRERIAAAELLFHQNKYDPRQSANVLYIGRYTFRKLMEELGHPARYDVLGERSYSGMQIFEVNVDDHIHVTALPQETPSD